MISRRARLSAPASFRDGGVRPAARWPASVRSRSPSCAVDRRLGEHFRASPSCRRRCAATCVLFGARALFARRACVEFMGLRRESTEATFRNPDSDAIRSLCPSSSCSPTARVPTRSTRRWTVARFPRSRGCATKGGLHTVTSCFPSVTGPAYAPFLMGRFPGSDRTARPSLVRSRARGLHAFPTTRGATSAIRWARSTATSTPMRRRSSSSATRASAR